jgi:hypothetical protein
MKEIALGLRQVEPYAGERPEAISGPAASGAGLLGDARNFRGAAQRGVHAVRRRSAERSGRTARRTKEKIRKPLIY